MKVLFDNNVPAYLLALFPDAQTAFRAGWHELANGKLLAAAEAQGYELLVTLDRGFANQQNMSGRSIAVAILSPVDQSRASMQTAAEQLFDMLRLGPIAGVKVVTALGR